MPARSCTVHAAFAPGRLARKLSSIDTESLETMVVPLLEIASHDGNPIGLLPSMANRHGCITGATGTGKTVTLQVLAERFSRIGTPVFLVDVKGDLSGLSQSGRPTPKLLERLQKLGLPQPEWNACPVTFWDVYGERGHPVRATISDMGPLLLSRLLDLNDTQTGVLNIAFRVADDNGLLLLDLKDLRAMLNYVSQHITSLRTQYGNISPVSIGAIQRSLLALEDQGGTHFFGEPMLEIRDLMQTRDGRGVVNILAGDRLIQSPRIYATFLLWLLAELFEHLPEVGDPEQPHLVFFFDEAHLLFNGAPSALVEKVEQVVRLIRSKGVGIYFVTQNPIDIPDRVLGQLGNRVQHALRAFTPRDQKAVRATAQTMRANPEIDIETVITQLGVGEALVSFLDEKGIPGITQRVWMAAPGTHMGPISDDDRRALMSTSLLGRIYDTPIDRESAYEVLMRRAAEASSPTAAGAWAGGSSGWGGALNDFLFGSTGPRGGRREGLVQAVLKSGARNATNQIIRGVLGSLLRSKR